MSAPREFKITPEDYGGYRIKEYHIRGRSRCRIVIRMSVEKQFWVNLSRPSPRTEEVIRWTNISMSEAIHERLLHANTRYGQKYKFPERSTRKESCFCGDFELLAYYKATPETIQEEWDRFHSPAYHDHLHDYEKGAHVPDGHSFEMSDDDEEDPIRAGAGAGAGADSGAGTQ